MEQELPIQLGYKQSIAHKWSHGGWAPAQVTSQLRCPPHCHHDRHTHSASATREGAGIPSVPHNVIGRKTLPKLCKTSRDEGAWAGLAQG